MIFSIGPFAFAPTLLILTSLLHLAACKSLSGHKTTINPTSIITVTAAVTSTTTTTSTSSATSSSAIPLVLDFGPYLTSTCQQSFVPGGSQIPPIVNVTEEYCVDAPYVFGSYFIDGNAETERRACQLTLFAEKACVGASVARVVGGLPWCDEPGFQGRSVVLSCDDA